MMYEKSQNSTCSKESITTSPMHEGEGRVNVLKSRARARKVNENVYLFASAIDGCMRRYMQLDRHRHGR